MQVHRVCKGSAGPRLRVQRAHAVYMFTRVRASRGSGVLFVEAVLFGFEVSWL